MAVVEQLERDTVRLRAAYAVTNRNPLGACAITGTGFPIDRGRTSALLGFDGPTGNTYGSIATVDYLLESVGGRGGAARRARPGRSGPAAVVHGASSATCGCRTGSSSAAASCRRSATPWRSSTRARSPARRSGRRRPSCSPSTTRLSATSSIPKTICSRSSPRCSRDGARAVRLVAAAMSGASSTSRSWPSARRRLDHRHRAGRHAGARARRAFPGGPRRSRPAWSPRAGTAPERRSCRRFARGVDGSAGKEIVDMRDDALARDAEPAAFRRGAKDARRSGAVRDARAIAASRMRWPSDRRVAARTRRGRERLSGSADSGKL